MTEYTIRPLERSDREWVAHFLDERWGTTQIVSLGKAVYGHLLPGFIAERTNSNSAEEPPSDLDEGALSLLRWLGGVFNPDLSELLCLIIAPDAFPDDEQHAKHNRMVCQVGDI